MHPSNQCPFKIRKSELAHVHEPVIYICKFSFMTSTFKVATNCLQRWILSFSPSSSFQTWNSPLQTDVGRILQVLFELRFHQIKQIVAKFQFWASDYFRFSNLEFNDTNRSLWQHSRFEPSSIFFSNLEFIVTNRSLPLEVMNENHLFLEYFIQALTRVASIQNDFLHLNENNFVRGGNLFPPTLGALPHEESPLISNSTRTTFPEQIVSESFWDCGPQHTVQRCHFKAWKCEKVKP